LKRYFAASALLPHGWATDVAIDVDDAGTIVGATAGAQPGDAVRLVGHAVPGMPNVHSHAFQRAFAGRAERMSPDRADSFWTWREQMYGLVERLDADDVEAIATWLYVEMLKAGYTAVGEFHYLHHDREGKRYAAPTELAHRIVAGARASGIGLTLLPVVYEHAGFGGVPAHAGQRRFLTTADEFAAYWDALERSLRDDPQLRLGVAPHSLRAVGSQRLLEILAHVSARDPRAPIHIHVAEQQAEVDDCVAWSGLRPVAWLLRNAPVTESWTLVHATHVDGGELAGIVDSGAVAGLCPTTEANLGDGVFPAEQFLRDGGRFGIGSDSNVTIDVAEELRLLEYGQRLTARRRAVLGDERAPHVGARLYRDALAGGARSLARAIGALAPGTRADIVVLDSGRDAVLEGASGDDLLDRYVFASGARAVRDVIVGGRRLVHDGHHADEARIEQRYRSTVRTLFG
jgi:formimidoylglutamate deiminase